MSVCSLVLQDLCNLSSIVSICASILFLKSWVIFSIITLNYFSDELLIASSFSHSCKFLSCSFIWNFIVCHFTFSDLLCLCSPFCRLQDFISFYLWSLPLSGWGWLRGFSCYPLDGGGGGRELIGGVVNRAYPKYWTGLPLYAYHWGTLSDLFWCLCQKLSLSLLHSNKTLLYKISEQSSLVTGPRLNSSPPKAKNLGIFCGSAAIFRLGGSSRILQNKVRILGALVLCSPSEHVFFCTWLTLQCVCMNE